MERDLLMAWLTISDGTYEQNLAVFLQLEALVNQTLGYPNIETKTTRYAEPVVHPDNVQIAFAVAPAVEQAYYNDPTVKALVDSLIPNAPSKLVETLPLEWMPDGGDS